MQRSFVHISIAFLLFLGLVFLNATGSLNVYLDWGRVGTDTLTAPLSGILRKVKNFFEITVNLNDLANQNAILTKQVEELTGELATLEKARQENQVLREALGLRGETKLSTVPAEIVSLDVLNINQEVILDRGEKHGVEKGNAVIVPGNILVGVVTKTFENTSQMQLLTSSEITVNAQVSDSAATGLVRGEHGLGMLFDQIEQTEVIKAGDLVVTSGLGGQFPKDLLIGKIAEIRSSPSELFQKASLIPATNLQNLRIVLVVKNEK